MSDSTAALEGAHMNLKVFTAPVVSVVATSNTRFFYDSLRDAGVPAKEATNHGHKLNEISPLDLICETAGRLCYMSFGKGRDSRDYFTNILASRHGSILEHASVSLIISGISRSLTHEFVRHRAGWAYSQLSQRYVDERDVGFVVPPELLSLGENSPEYCRWHGCCLDALTRYRALVDALSARDSDADRTEARKRVRQAARSVLPNCTETKLMATGNLRAIRHFLTLRGTRHADLEIRRLAVLLAKTVVPLAPLALQDVSVFTDGDGIESVRVAYGSV
jgi:thymidylate synthase (FAD)